MVEGLKQKVLWKALKTSLSEAARLAHLGDEFEDTLQREVVQLAAGPVLAPAPH